MTPKNHTKILILLSTLLAIIATAVFIITYCDLFDYFSLLAKQRLLDHPFLTFFVTPTLFWLSAYLCRKYSPNAAGNHLQSAITKLKKYPDNFEKVSPFLNARLVIIKTISSLISSFGGGALGKEGPSVHMSAAIFTIFSQRFKKFLPKITLETWILAGSAVGLTLVFNAPIAGIIFICEKLVKIGYKNLKQDVLWALISVAIVTIIFHHIGPIFLFHEVSFEIKNLWQLMILTAVICGFLSLAVKSLCNYFYLKISAIKSNWWHAAPLIIGLVVAAINFHSGIYAFGGGIYTIQQTFFSDSVLLAHQEVWGRILNTILTFASGSAGGLIAPAMTIGAGIGSIASTFAPSADIGIFLLIGMAAFLSVMLGEPITAAFIILETTGQNIAAVPFLLAAALIAFGSCRGFEKSRVKVQGWREDRS